jgi:hypothetical protein
METEKTKRIKRIVTVSLRGSEKKTEGKYNNIYKSEVVGSESGQCVRVERLVYPWTVSVS